jgi:hypothetical protein
LTLTKKRISSKTRQPRKPFRARGKNGWRNHAFRIRVNAVFPGTIHTDWLGRVTDKLNKTHPIGRTGTPQEVLFEPDGSDEDVLTREGAVGQLPRKRSAGGLPSGGRRYFRLKKLCNYLTYE